MSFLARCILIVAKYCLALRYRLEIKGLEQLEGLEKGLVFLPNHVAFIDPVIIMTLFGKRYGLRPVSDKNQLNIPVFGKAIHAMRPFLLPDVRRGGRKNTEEIHNTLAEASKAVSAGENVLIYPSGRITYDGQEHIQANSAAYQLASQAGATPVLIRATGLWGSRFSRAYGTEPDLVKLALTALKAVFANALFFMPKRRVVLEIHIAPKESLTDKATFNKTLENFYNSGPNPAYSLPIYFWQGSKLEALPPIRQSGKHHVDLSRVDGETTKKVMDFLHERTGSANITPEQSLGNDLGLDSLTSVEIAVWLSTEFGVYVTDTSALKNVADILLAASGEALGSGQYAPPPAPPLWSKTYSYTAPFERCRSLTQLYVAAASRLRFKPIAADMNGGVKHYAAFSTSLFVLQKAFKQIAPERVGLLMPAGTASAAAYYGLLFSGKTPVLLNWTHGAGVVRSNLERLGVTHIVSARAVMSALDLEEADFAPANFVFLEDIGKAASAMEKAWAMARAYVCPQLLSQGLKEPETAAILFTSGSEALPKAVPLTHSNFVSILQEIPKLVELAPTDRIMGILPPFHSFGLLLNLLVPYTLGIGVAYYPNPTEGANIAAIIKEYRTSILAATPTFLQGILRVAAPGELAHLRYGVVGAEKCPDAVYERFALCAPRGLLLEGYGITECAPLISLNRPWNIHRGSLGQPIDCLQRAIVDVESGLPVQQGERGLLLVRGPNVFGGYLTESPSPFMRYEGQDWYNTGDLVREAEGGVLFFEGRLKRFIKIGGEMLSLTALEQTINTRLGSEDSAFAVEAHGPEERPELVLFATSPVTRDQVNSNLREAGLSGLYTIRRIIQLEALPLLGTGKVDYPRLKTMLRDDSGEQG